MNKKNYYANSVEKRRTGHETGEISIFLLWEDEKALKAKEIHFLLRLNLINSLNFQRKILKKTQKKNKIVS